MDELSDSDVKDIMQGTNAASAIYAAGRIKEKILEEVK